MGLKDKSKSKAKEKKRERLQLQRRIDARIPLVKAANANPDPLAALPSFKVNYYILYLVIARIF